LKIRDRILLESGNIFGDSENVTVAKENVGNNIEKIERIANQVLLENGVKMQATASVCNMFFNTKKYEKFTMPAGKYDALRITIGEAKGKNWWCVLYPALCIPAASENTIEENFSVEEQEIVTTQKPEYEIKFASVEIWEKVVDFFTKD
ncbi:MAG: stage II sporulation protein R, partial [Oscillospiraceae bacterium]